jgi:hypothetical protein
MVASISASVQADQMDDGHARHRSQILPAAPAIQAKHPEAGKLDDPGNSAGLQLSLDAAMEDEPGEINALAADQVDLDLLQLQIPAAAWRSSAWRFM